MIPTQSLRKYAQSRIDPQALRPASVMHDGTYLSAQLQLNNPLASSIFIRSKERGNEENYGLIYGLAA